MNSLRIVFAMAACGASATTLACDYPTLVAIPDGETASMEELITAQASVKDYMGGMEAYLTCVNEELEAAGDDAPGEFKAIMVNRHNTAVTEMEAVAASFNEQVSAYREAHPEPEQ